MFPEGRILDFLIVGAVALVVVGPKDLPILMRKVGQFLAKMRAMAAEFRASFDELARQSELDELRREVEAMRAGRPLESAVAVDPPTQTVFDDIHAGLKEAGAQLHPPMSYQTSVARTGASPPEPVSGAAEVAAPVARPRAARKPRAARTAKSGTPP
jgi:sec-independent protein translocase protein TatB